MQNKVIIVSGGSGLLGKLMLEDLRKKGAIALNADISVETDPEKHNLHCDITSESSIADTVSMVIKKFGRLDGLVNNAYPRTRDWGAKFEAIPADSWRKNVDIQMNSVFMFCQHALAVMKQQQAGSIVNISSVYGTVGPDFTVYDGTEMTMPAAYSAIKGGIVNFTRYLAAYYGPSNVRINCVSPGGIFDNQPEVFVKNYESKVPMRRMGKPGDIAPAVTFLLSDDAGYISGQNLHVDGGWTAI